MKRIIIIGILLITSLLSAKDIAEKKIEPKTKQFGLSAGFVSRFDYGVGKISQSANYTKEGLVGIHAGVGPFLVAGGVYLRTNHFRNPTRLGMFYRTNVGVDVVSIVPRSDEKAMSTFIFPNISAGIGHSSKLGDSSQFRISFNLGIMAVLASINLEIAF